MGTIVRVACKCGFTNTLCIGSGMVDREIFLLSSDLDYTPRKIKYHWLNKETNEFFVFFSYEKYELTEFISENTLFHGLDTQEPIMCPSCQKTTLKVNFFGHWD